MLTYIGYCTVGAGIANLFARFYPFMIPMSVVRHKLRPNDGSDFVMITGGTDGIGKCYADYFKKQGYNLILLGRNPIKLEQTVNHLNGASLKLHKSDGPINHYHMQDGTRVITLSQDYSLLGTIHEQQEYLNLLQQLFSEHSIPRLSYLFNNAGQTYVSKLATMQLNNLNYLVNVNVLSNVLNSHFVAKRWPDTTIINLSSLIGGEFPSGYLGIYAGTKAFVKQIHQSLGEEEPSRLVVNLTPYFVSTKMIRYQQLSFQTVSAEDFVTNSLKVVVAGKSESCGHWKHEILKLFYQIYPYRYSYRSRRDSLEKAQKIQDRKSKK